MAEKRRIVVLDDIRNYPFEENDEGTTLRNSMEALKFLGQESGERVKIDELWLDFDLGGVLRSELFDTAMPVALWLAECAYEGSPYPVKQIVIHTMNPVGREAMRSLLERFGYEVKCVWPHFHV